MDLTISERLVNVFSQKKALEMARKRKIMASLFNEPFKSGSRFNRSIGTWRPNLWGPNSAFSQAERHNIIARCIDAWNNQPFVRAAISRVKTEVIGTGLKPQSAIDRDILGLTEEDARAKQKEIEKKFLMWSTEANECDIRRQSNFFQLQELSYLSHKISGDCFVSTPFRINIGGIFGTKIQIIESERVSNPSNLMNTSRMVDGVELDEVRAPFRIHVRMKHPGETFETEDIFTWKELPIFGAESGRRRIFHIVNYERPGQIRGIPMASIALKSFKQIDRYADAEEFAAIVTADPCIFVKTELGQGLGNFSHVPPGGENAFEPGANFEDEIRVEPGAVIDLRPGESIDQPKPGRPNNLYEPFVLAKIKEGSAAMEIPFEILLVHFSASFSASRAAFLIFSKFVNSERMKFVANMCRPTWNAWMDDCVKVGILDLPGYEEPIKRQAWNRAVWHGPAMGSIKELEAVKAAKERIELKISDRETEAARIGNKDIDKIFSRLAQEEQQMKELGLSAKIEDDEEESGTE